MELKESVAVVSGASSGLGKAISKKLASEGVKVGLLARSNEKLEQVRIEIEEKGGSSMCLPADLSIPEEVKQAVINTVSAYGAIDILVNNAGLGIFKLVEEMSIEEWDKHINVMLRGAFLLTKECLPHIYKNERGHIIVVSSLWSKRFCAKCAGYTAAKFGVRGFVQSLREEAREHNVKVTNVMPGTVETPFFDKADWETDLSRALQPEDIAGTVVHALQLPDRAVIEEVSIQAIRPDQCTS